MKLSNLILITDQELGNKNENTSTSVKMHLS
jgi:hypothetical protein